MAVAEGFVKDEPASPAAVRAIDLMIEFVHNSSASIERRLDRRWHALAPNTSSLVRCTWMKLLCVGRYANTERSAFEGPLEV